MSDSSIQDRLNAVRELMKMFRLERILYLITAILSLGVIFYFGSKILSKTPETSALVAIAGAGGLISVGMGRLLTMWTQALRLVAGEALGD